MDNKEVKAIQKEMKEMEELKNAIMEKFGWNEKAAESMAKDVVKERIIVKG